MLNSSILLIQLGSEDNWGQPKFSRFHFVEIDVVDDQMIM